jgi:glycosyltransferase involved in cell wall biosynthesis
MTNHTVKNQKLFSIIMATYNCGQKVENTLDSIFSQNSDLFEVIVMDSVSTDETLDFLKKYEDRVTLVTEKDEGIYHAFNRAIDLATGKYLYFIGAGDCLKSGILEEIKDFLPLEKPSVIYGKVFFAKCQKFNGKEFDAKLFVRDNLCQQGIFYHRDIFQIAGKFDLQYKIFADWFFNLRCFMNERIRTRYVDCVIADYEEGGVSSDINSDKVFLRNFPRFVRKNFGIYQYLLCKAFLRNPYIFNYIYYGKFYLLMFHLIYQSPFLTKSASLSKSFFGSFKRKKMSHWKEKTIE